MCRIAAYTGPEIPLENIVIRPAHSLLSQSQNATEAKLAVNGDGFGISWYGNDERPGLYRDVLPAWADDNLTNLCRMVRSRLFIAHVRASTMGETSRTNCHPFTYGHWSFCHNGQIPHFKAIRRQLEADLPDDLFNAKQGSTDSEMIFLKHFALNLNHLTLPEIKDFNALGDEECLKLNAKRYNVVEKRVGQRSRCRIASDVGHGWDRASRRAC